MSIAESTLKRQDYETTRKITGDALGVRQDSDMANILERPQRLKVVRSDDPKRGERSAWFVSLLVHFLFLLAISLLSIQVGLSEPALVLTAPIEDEVELDERKPEEFHFSPTEREQIGGSAMGGLYEQATEDVEIRGQSLGGGFIWVSPHGQHASTAAELPPARALPGLGRDRPGPSRCRAPCFPAW